MRTLKLAVVGCLLYIAPSLAVDCGKLNKNECNNNFPQCQILTAKSCCGEVLEYCTATDSNQCLYSNVQCKKQESTGKVYEFWSSCVPSDGFTQFNPNNSTCDSLGCAEKNMQCKYTQQACHETSCCPDVPTCQIPATGGGPSTSGGATGQGTSGGQPGSCDKVDCPNGFNCYVINQIATCVAQGGSTSGASITGGSTTTGGSTSTTGGSSSTTTGGSSGTTTGGSSSTTGWATTGSVDCCHNVNCPDGFHCESQNGKAVCVCDDRDSSEEKECDACEHVHCPRGYHCLAQPKGGWIESHKHKHWQLHPKHCGNNPNKVKAICVRSPIGTCHHVKCPPGFECRTELTGPRCVKKQKPRCLTCADMHCEQNGLLCVLTPQKKVDEDCCPIIPVCINPNTIAGSTIATTTATTYHTTGSTIASVATFGSTTGGGRGSIFPDEPIENDDDDYENYIEGLENDELYDVDPEYFEDDDQDRYDWVDEDNEGDYEWVDEDNEGDQWYEDDETYDNNNQDWEDEDNYAFDY